MRWLGQLAGTARSLGIDPFTYSVAAQRAILETIMLYSYIPTSEACRQGHLRPTGLCCRRSLSGRLSRQTNASNGRKHKLSVDDLERIARIVREPLELAEF